MPQPLNFETMLRRYMDLLIHIEGIDLIQYCRDFQGEFTAQEIAWLEHTSNQLYYEAKQRRDHGRRI